MTLDTKSEQLLTAASDKLNDLEEELRAHRDLRLADDARQIHYLIYLVLKPDAQLIREPTTTIPVKPPARNKKKRK